MNKTFAMLIALVAMMFAVDAMAFTPPASPAPKSWISDTSHVLSDAAHNRLDQKLRQINQSSANEIAALIVPTLEGTDIADVGDLTSKAWGVGKKDLDNGVLVVLAMKEHKSRISTGKGVEGDLPDLKCNDILNNARPYLRRGDVEGALGFIFDSSASAIANHRAEASALAQKQQSAPTPALQPQAVSTGNQQHTSSCAVSNPGQSTGIGWGTWLVMLGLGGTVIYLMVRARNRRLQEEEQERLARARRAEERAARIRENQERLARENAERETRRLQEEARLQQEARLREQERIAALNRPPPAVTVPRPSPRPVMAVPVTRPAIPRPNITTPVTLHESAVPAAVGAAAALAASEALAQQLEENRAQQRREAAERRAREQEAEERRARERDAEEQRERQLEEDRRERAARAREREEEERQARARREQEEADARRRQQEEDDRRSRESSYSSSSSSWDSGSSSSDSGSSWGGGGDSGGFGGGDSGGGGSSSDW